MTNTLTYSEFKARKINFRKTQPSYLQNLESDFNSITRFQYKMYLNGKVPVYAKS